MGRIAWSDEIGWDICKILRLENVESLTLKFVAGELAKAEALIEIDNKQAKKIEHVLKRYNLVLQDDEELLPKEA